MKALNILTARRRRFSRRPLVIGTCGVAFLALSGPAALGPRVIYNPSESAPVGWYRLLAPDSLKVDDYLLVHLPDDSRRLAAERGYLPETVPLLKRIGAVSGQFVCVRGNQLWIDGELAATALTHDGKGRPLIMWKGCRVLDLDEILLISRDNSASFDSRYFGPIRLTQVIGKASPLYVK